jgi:hypothetical protein
MTQRSKTETIEFANSFALAGVAGTRPPGAYDVETIEEMIEGLSFQAFRRVSTTLTPQALDPVTRTRQVTEINPDDLQDALTQDRQVSASKAASVRRSD